jgi:hypothetical protein
MDFQIRVVFDERLESRIVADFLSEENIGICGSDDFLGGVDVLSLFGFGGFGVTAGKPFHVPIHRLKRCGMANPAEQKSVNEHEEGFAGWHGSGSREKMRGCESNWLCGLQVGMRIVSFFRHETTLTPDPMVRPDSFRAHIKRFRSGGESRA